MVCRLLRPGDAADGGHPRGGMTMAQQIPIDPNAEIGRSTHEGTHEVTADVAYQRLAIVNVVYHGSEGAADRQWILIDAGVNGSGPLIEGVSEARYGKESRPAAIV